MNKYPPCALAAGHKAIVPFVRAIMVLSHCLCVRRYCSNGTTNCFLASLMTPVTNSLGIMYAETLYLAEEACRLKVNTVKKFCNHPIRHLPERQHVECGSTSLLDSSNMSPPSGTYLSTAGTFSTIPSADRVASKKINSLSTATLFNINPQCAYNALMRLMLSVSVSVLRFCNNFFI